MKSGILEYSTVQRKHKQQHSEQESLSHCFTGDF